MRIKSLTQKCLPLLLSFVLVFSSFPIPVLAGDQSQTPPWAVAAKEALNEIYVDNSEAVTFSGSNEFTTVGDMRNLLLYKFRYPEDGSIVASLGSDDGSNLTRLQAARVIFHLYQLDRLVVDPQPGEFDDCDHPAAATLHLLGIANGKANGVFAPEEPVTNAELAVMFYRALRTIGALYRYSEQDRIRPGQYGYDEFMYLFTRNGVIRDADPYERLDSASIEREEPLGSGEYSTYAGKEAIWNMWRETLDGLPPGRSDSRTVTLSVYGSVYVAAANTILDGAVLIVGEDRAALNNDINITGIFSDVEPSSWYYGGVMYLFNSGMVTGYGNGNFGPEDEVIRLHLAGLMCRLNGIDTRTPAENVVVNDVDPDSYWYAIVTHAINNGYMTYADPVNKNFAPYAPATREAAAKAIFLSYDRFNPEDVNLAVLDRFTDGTEIDDGHKTAMAYLVSAGVISGYEDGSVQPGRETNRAEFGVLLARVMAGIDSSKMHDYEAAVTEVLGQ